jgi:hypothetical protein
MSLIYIFLRKFQSLPQIRASRTSATRTELLSGWQMSYVGKCPRVAMIRVAKMWWQKSGWLMFRYPNKDWWHWGNKLPQRHSHRLNLDTRGRWSRLTTPFGIYQLLPSWKVAQCMTKRTKFVSLRRGRRIAARARNMTIVLYELLYIAL